MAKPKPINPAAPISRLRGVLDLLRWPVERVYWAIEEWVVWPLREEVSALGLPARAAAGGAPAAPAICAVALGAVPSSPRAPGSPPQPLATTELSAEETVVPTPEPEPVEPVLQGAAPVLSHDGTVATVREPEEETAAAPTDAPSTADTESTETGAAASSSKAVPAGPDAMKVARRFAEAFVVYEVGEEQASARAAFEVTATPELAGALAKRPPRLPEKAKIPRAKVVNLVPGPRRGKAYSVSVSLLRVGVTSELRLELRRNTNGWLVTDVRG